MIYRVIQVTVFFNFSLTDTKKLKNGKTQPFLLRIYLDILIFWCLSMARWKKSCFSGLCQNSVNSPPCKEWAPRQPFRHIRTPQTFRDTIQIPPIHPPDTIQALFDINKTNWHQQTLPNFPGPPRYCLRMAKSACWRQPVSVSTALRGNICFTWSYWDIKISKCPHISWTKMVGFYHFLVL